MTTNDLISEIRSRKITIRVVGTKLRVSPPSAVDSELAEAIRKHKPELLKAFSQANSQADTPLADFDSRVFGDTPRWIQHKLCDCHSTKHWQHRWAGFFCMDCWPPTDTAMRIETNDQPIPRPDPQQPDHRREWTAEEQSLINWFNQYFDSLPAEHFQHKINLSGLRHQLSFGPAYREVGKVIADIRLLKAEPERFHDLLEQRHLRNLNKWKFSFGKRR